MHIPSILKALREWLKANPNALSAKRAAEPKPPAPLADSPPAKSGLDALNWREALIKLCEELGREKARATRAVKIDTVVLKSVEEQAASWAKAAAPELYNPEGDAHDRRVDANLKRFDAGRDEHLAQAATAGADLRTREEDLARIGPLSPFPEVSGALRLTAICGITFSIAPIAHDVLNGLPPNLRWLVAAIFAAGFAVFIVSAALPDASPEDAHVETSGAVKVRTGVFVAGLIISLAFFAVRLSLSRTFGDLLLSVGTALPEIGILIHIERRGTKLLSDRNGWCARRDERLKAEALIAVAKADEEKHLASANEMKREIASLEAKHLMHRVWGVKTDIVIDMAVKAARSAYIAQVAINRGSGTPPEGGK